ncbi:flavin reductase family protein [Gluconacetobacter azotocaptans]|uniref:flavin reductase family protein n=1 Tax=Gluconacetobacter azotocaptans TaxID=142834 RepID=UPI00195CFD3C|nr:flavin reductase family protein [Gluconacetobacter azotocaptans]MBM9400791.1 flavin reductase family protein [Gluconacetobacter azotocaptans]
MLIHQFKDAMSHVAGTVAVLTTLHSGRPFGLAATSVTSVSVDPPTLLVCVSKTASAHDRIALSGRFAANILRHDDVAQVLPFASHDAAAERFASADWEIDSLHPPILKTALASLTCDVRKHVDYHSHTVFFGEVTQIALKHELGSPLLYVRRQYAACRELESI